MTMDCFHIAGLGPQAACYASLPLSEQQYLATELCKQKGGKVTSKVVLSSLPCHSTPNVSASMGVGKAIVVAVSSKEKSIVSVAHGMSKRGNPAS